MTRLTTLLLLGTAMLPTASSAQAKDAAPNVIFFLTDDQRNDFLGCYGHSILKTPNIDRLAKQGVLFRNAFVTTSICAASRASIFTGMYERTHKYTFGMPPLTAALIRGSYPATLRRAGYRVGFVGKFGVSVRRSDRLKMFDFFVPLNRSPYFKKRVDGSSRHVTEIAGDEAVRFLRTNPRNRPFCLSVSFNASHAEDGDKKNHFPWPRAMNGRYENARIPPPRLSQPAIYESQPDFLKKSLNRVRWFWRWDTPAKYQQNIRGYYRMISGIDRVIGRVLQESRNLGYADNTVVIYSADNGYYAGSRGFAGKWSHYEESLRVPMIIYDPRLPKAKRGRQLDQQVLNIDIPATIVDVALEKQSSTYQGKSFAWALRDTQTAPDNWRNDFFCEHLMQVGERIPKYEGVRGQRWVYARYFEQKPPYEFLHDLQNDPDQLKNLAKDPQHAAQLGKMRKRCDELRDTYGGKFSRRKFPRARRRRR